MAHFSPPKKFVEFTFKLTPEELQAMIEDFNRISVAIDSVKEKPKTSLSDYKHDFNHTMAPVTRKLFEAISSGL